MEGTNKKRSTRPVALAAVALAAIIAVLMLASCSAEPKTVAKVKLTANAGTGYEWVVSGNEDGVLQQTNLENTSAEGDAAGGPVETVYTFEAAKEGTTSVTFTLSRPWEESEDDEYVTYDFTVDSNKNITFDGSNGTYTEITAPELISQGA